MLISRISDESEGAGEGHGIEVERDSSQEYQTASELFELMTKNRHFDDNDEDSLTTQDLVLLYKNIDIGTRLMSGATEVRRRKPNQYVETVVYNDEPEYDSDISENYSTDDMHNIFKINQERLNLFDNGSFDNILCHKLGGLEIKTSDLSTDYNKQFLFKDPYIQNRLKGMNVMASCSEFDSLLPTSLLDYICCKRLEDNYNLDMDNIIRYVRHTIEQLKRISNGDYLTDRVKEKWEEVNKNYSQIHGNTKVLATSTSIPLHVDCRKRRNATWDDIVHSEVDLRSLSKILEKKIIVEIPKLICGSYRLFSKRRDENLIIRCKRGKQEKHREDSSRVDVVLQLQRSQTGHVISKINSIMILQPTPAVPDLRIPEILPITFDSFSDEIETDSKENAISVIECLKDEHVAPEQPTDTEADIQEVITEMFDDRCSLKDESNIETNYYPFSDTECGVTHDMTSNNLSSESSVALREILLDKPGMFQINQESDFNIITPDELRVTMLRLNKQSSLLEESGEDASVVVSSKKKSPMRVRIKSPYENQSYILEEKKRKRLLEIREKREKKKMALGESAKVSKHNRLPAKVSSAPQPSGSVTKLSITNKSFYNSIYGQSLNGTKSSKSNPRKGVKRDSLALEIPVEQTQEEYFESPNLTPEKNGKKYINRSYYLDDTETAMMFMQIKQGENKDVGNTCSASTSAVSNEFSANLNLLSHLIATSDSDLNKYETDDDKQNQSLEDHVFNNSKDACCSSNIPPAKVLAPKSSPKAIGTERDDNEIKKVPITLECRKSIDKLYDLMKKLGKTSKTDLKNLSKLNVNTVEKADAMTGGSTIQGSDSGTSLKHHLTSSNPSCFSFEKPQPRIKATRKKEQAANVVPKVIISSKLPSPKLETDRLKKDRKKFITSQTPKTVPENPLRAISQLLHDFDNIQKTKQKVTTSDIKSPKKIDIVSVDGKTILSRQNSFRRRSRIDQCTREREQEIKVPSPRDKRTRPFSPLEISRIPHQQSAKDARKKISDILDEAKEARGEAVRGPPKLNSRLNSLAQPKRSYVQAHSEEYQNKYGKNLMADRLQRLATSTNPPIPLTEPLIRNISSPISRNRQVKREVTSSVSVKQPPSSVQSIDKAWETRRSNSSSPNRNPTPPAFHKHTVSDAPENIKKMVAVESYVNSHYGNSSPFRCEQLLGGNKSRVPLLPSDLEIASMTSSPGIQEAGELGKKLHHIIHSMITTTNLPTALHEARETTSKLSPDVTDDLSTDDVSKDQRTDSDYNIDILEDTNLETAVEGQSADKREEMIDENFEHSYTHNQELQPFSSTAELEKLENALYNQISGAFQKRLRIKKMTLSPKQSLQQMFLLQSGDAGPLLVKSTVSNLKSKSETKSLQDLKSVSVLSKAHLNWNFAQIPMQIATVGYSFPLYQPDCGSKLDLKSVHVSRTVVSDGRMSCKSDKISQCFKGVHQELKLEQAAQVDVQEIVAGPKVISDTEVIIAETSEELLDGVTVEPKGIDTTTNHTEENTPTIEKLEIDIRKNVEKTSETPVSQSPSPVNVDYTSSLDMLVGLLNEIQNITCQHKDPLSNELESMLNNAAALEKDSPRYIISMSSLGRLKKLESNPSIHSFYKTNEGFPSSRCDNNLPYATKPVFVDKEVNVNLCEKECVNISTNVPSVLPIAVNHSTNVTKSLIGVISDPVLPIAVNHSTNITKSLIGVISDPSSQSLVSFTDYSTLYSNRFFYSQSVKKKAGMSQVESNEKPKESKKSDLNEKCSEIVTPPPTIKIQRAQKSNKIKQYSLNTDTAKHFDGAIKIKRDILVTVYSILVFTVFAALSFPGIAIMEGL